jgi:hypothetical protein
VTDAKTWGTIIAAPSPWMTRAAIRLPAPGDSAQATDDSVNRLTPARKIRFRPYRSARRVPVMMKTA